MPDRNGRDLATATTRKQRSRVERGPAPNRAAGERTKVGALYALGVVALVWAALTASFRFVADDLAQILGNPTVTGLHWAAMWTAGYHVLEAVLAAAGLAWFLLLRRVGLAQPVLLAAAILWAAQPGNASTIAWVSCSADPLCMLFGVGAIALWVLGKSPRAWRCSPRSGRCCGRWWRWC